MTPAVKQAVRWMAVEFYLILAAAVVLAGLALYGIFFSTIFAPVRAWFLDLSAGHADVDDFLQELALIVVVTFAVPGALALIVGIVRLLRPRRQPTRRQMQEAVEKGMAESAAFSAKVLETSLAEMRKQGSSEVEIAEFRALMQQSHAQAEADAREEMQLYVDHPKLLERKIEEIVQGAGGANTGANEPGETAPRPK